MAKTPTTPAKDDKQGDLIEKIELTAGSEQIENPVQDEEVQVEVDEPEIVEDASAKLQEQITALKKSEEIQKGRAERYRQEAEKAQQAAKDRTSEIDKVRKEAVQSQLDTVSTALGAAKEAAESAKRDIRTAKNNGDVDAEIEAIERFSVATNNISQLEGGKLDLEAKIKEPPKAEEPAAQQQNAMPQIIQDWVNKNQSRLSPKLWDKIKANHWDIVDDEGIPFDSPEYIESMETKLGWRESETDDEPVVIQQRQPAQRTSIVSAPVSREAPSTPNNDRNTNVIKLTPSQREAAKIAGVTEKVYAEQLQRINKAKANGTYGGQ